MGVAIVADALLNLLDVGRSQVCVQSGLAGDALQKLLLGVLAAEAEADEVGSGQATGTLWRERSLAVQCVVGVDGSSVVVSRHTDATTEMADDEVQVFVVLANLLGEAAGDGSLVQGVPDADAVHQWRPADAGVVVQLVDDAGVGDERAAARYRLGYLVGYQTAQVAGMIVHGDARMGVVEHLLVDFVHTTGNGLHQSATTYHGVELQGHAHALQLVEHQLLAVVELLNHIVEARQLLVRMADASQHQWLLVFIDGHLGRCGAGVDGKNQHTQARANE